MIYKDLDKVSIPRIPKRPQKNSNCCKKKEEKNAKKVTMPKISTENVSKSSESQISFQYRNDAAKRSY